MNRRSRSRALFERAQHLVQCHAEAARLLRGRGLRKPAARIAARLDLACDTPELVQRPKRTAHEQPDRSGRRRRRADAAEDDEEANAMEVLLDRPRRRRDHDRAARRRCAADVRQRRDVHPNRLGTDAAVRVAGPATSGRRGDQPGRGQHAPAETERARDDPPVLVDDLDGELLAPERRLEHSRRRHEQRGSRRAQPGDLRGARSQRPVERTVELARGQDLDRRAQDHDRGDDRDRRSQCGTASERPNPHPSLKPTPRTVAISGGSPSFRRRYAT